MRAVDTYEDEYEILDWAKLRLFRADKAFSMIFGTRRFEVADGGGYRTDGDTFSFDAEELRNDFMEDGELLCLKILHMLAHCMLGHPFAAARRRRADAGREDLLMDLEAWELASKLWGSAPRFLDEAKICIARGENTELLYVDDHSVWTRADAEAAAKWRGDGEKILRHGAGRGRRRPGERRVTSEYTYTLDEGHRGEYREILKKFAVFREDFRTDLDSFQYSWYNYGIETYGNLPIIEPLEYSEDRKISDLVIAIDTSGSCVKELVRIFLEETRGIMEDGDLFFRHFCLHVIQCDNQIQSDAVVNTADGMDEYIENLTVKGGGGTDFRPVFERIEELKSAGELGSLKGLIYFTDGTGLYPRTEPDYEVIFVMPGDRYDDIDRPAWIRKVLF